MDLTEFTEMIARSDPANKKQIYDALKARWDDIQALDKSPVPLTPEERDRALKIASARRLARRCGRTQRCPRDGCRRSGRCWRREVAEMPD